MAIIFVYKKKKYKMNIKNNMSINEILSKFISIINENEKNIIFFYKGKNLSFKFENILKKLNNKDFIISVFNLKKKDNNNFNYIICPRCNNLSLLNINNNNKISLDNCNNNHKFDDIWIDEFLKNQNKYLENIEYSLCNNNRDLYNNNFYICSCGKNICKLCLENHKDENHNIIEYSKRYNICNNHEKEFISYCKDCKMNLCEKCEKIHNKHKIIMFKMMVNKIKIKEVKNKLYNNIEKINEYKDQINKLNEVYNNFIINLKNDLEDYIYLINKILYYTDNMSNYETIINVTNFKLEKLNSDIDNFLSINIKNKFIYLIDIFERYTNELDILYEFENFDNEINIFGSKFVKNNKKNIYIQ